MEGKIKWFRKEKGYGFILGEDEKDYFVHSSSLPEDMQDTREEDDKKVSFELKSTDRGPQAVEIEFL